MKRTLLTLFAACSFLALQAKSIVFTLNDKAGTRIYFKLGGETNPKLIIHDDGTFTINGLDYAFANVKHFAYSTEDYSGEKNTVDGIQALEKSELQLEGQVKVYDMAGRLVTSGEKAVVMKDLQRGNYVITNGVSTLKIHKQ